MAFQKTRRRFLSSKCMPTAGAHDLCLLLRKRDRGQRLWLAFAHKGDVRALGDPETVEHRNLRQIQDDREDDRRGEHRLCCA